MEDTPQLSKKERRAAAKEEKRKKREKQKRAGAAKKWGLIALVVLVIGFLGYQLVNWINTPTVDVSEQAKEITQTDWSKGGEEAGIVLVEYADFQCPACAGYAITTKRLSEEFGDDLKVVFRNLPLVTIHNNALVAAQAAGAAGAQGKFWGMHDILFERQEDWEDEKDTKDKFIGYAEELGLNTEQFENDFDSDAVKDKIDDDLVLANQLKFRSTPSFTLNGVIIKTPSDFDDFKELIETSLEESKQSPYGASWSYNRDYWSYTYCLHCTKSSHACAKRPQDRQCGC